MKAQELRIIFMGTPEFSVQILKGLIEGGYKVVGVVTAPDKSAGRGLKIQESEVKKYSVKQNLKVLQPDKLKNQEFLDELKSLNADLQIVVAFRMLPEQVWSMPGMGTFNLHASLLPQYRGAAPINWAIINGEEKTGLTTFLIDNKIDTGKILLKKEIEIKKTDTAGDLHDRMMIHGADLVKDTIDLIAAGNITPIKQTELINNPDMLKLAPKIFKEDCRINWQQKGEKIYNFIRGMSPFPCAWTTIRNTETGKILILKVFNSEYQLSAHQLNPGSLKFQKDILLVAVVDGFISLKEIQLEGKKKLKINEFLRGFAIENYILN